MSPALPKPLNTRGKHSARWRVWQGAQRAVVSRRQHGHCAEDGCREPAEWHHCFRRHQLTEPLSSHHTLCAGICRQHHRELHAEPNGDMDRRYQAEALTLAGVYFGYPLAIQTSDLLASAQQLEAQLEADGTMDKLREQAGYLQQEHP